MQYWRKRCKACWSLR